MTVGGLYFRQGNQMPSVFDSLLLSSEEYDGLVFALTDMQLILAIWNAGERQDHIQMVRRYARYRKVSCLGFPAVGLPSLDASSGNSRLQVLKLNFWSQGAL
jgi:hypothetical protein